MLVVLLQMAAMIAVGVAWRVYIPLGLKPEATRKSLTGLVYVVLLPALVLDVLWHAPMGMDTLRIALAATGGVLVALSLAVWLYRLLGVRQGAAGAMVLAAGFGNVTYLGLPVLEASLGPWARGVAIQYDLFACTPLLLTVGVVLAKRYGQGTDNTQGALRALLSVPPLWAAVLAISLQGMGIAPPAGVHGFLATLGAGVVPLMLVSLGMGLSWAAVGPGGLKTMAPAVAIQLLLTPALVWGISIALGLQGDMLTAVVLEGAMPCMVLGMVICDRYGLNTPLYAAAVTVSTLFSLATLPLWFRLLA
jgi:predicted permease